MESFHGMLNCYVFNIWALFLEMHIFEVVTCYITLPWSNQPIFFSGSLNVYYSSFSCFFPRSNRCYDNWKIVFFLFPWQLLLGKQIPSSLKEWNQTNTEFSRNIVIKLCLPQSNDADPGVGVKRYQKLFFEFLLPFVIYRTGFYLLFNIPYFFKSPLIASWAFRAQIPRTF